MLLYPVYGCDNGLLPTIQLWGMSDCIWRKWQLSTSIREKNVDGCKIVLLVAGVPLLKELQRHILYLRDGHTPIIFSLLQKKDNRTEQSVLRHKHNQLYGKCHFGFFCTSATHMVYRLTLWYNQSLFKVQNHSSCEKMNGHRHFSTSLINYYLYSMYRNHKKNCGVTFHYKQVKPINVAL